MGTFLVIVLVLIGIAIIKSIVRDAQRADRRARAVERRRRAGAQASAAAAPVQPPAPTTAADGESLIDNIGEAIVDGVVDTDIDVSQSGVYRTVARSEIRQFPDVDTNHQPTAESVEVEAHEVEADDGGHDHDDDTDTNSSDSGGWSWDDD